MKTKLSKFGTMLCAILIISGCGGGGSSSKTSSSFNSSGNTPILDTNTIQKVYKVEEGNLYVTQFKATDNSKVLYFIDGEDEKYFYINARNGTLSFRNRPNFEDKKTYNIIVVARDIVGNETTKPITINIQNLSEEDKDKTAPIFTSDTNFNMSENSSIRIMTSDMSEVTYSLKGNKSSDFDFDSSTGILTPKKLTATNYSFTIEARDTSGNVSTQKVSINIDKVEDQFVDAVSPELERDTSNPIFTSSNSISVLLSTQVDYTFAPSILEIQATDDSPVTYFLDGEDKNSFYLIDNNLYFSENAIPLQKSFYSLTLYATDIYGNQSSQDIQITINNDVGDNTAPRFLSPSTVTVPYSEQTDYSTAPSILTIQTDEYATLSIEGEDAESVYLSSIEMELGISSDIIVYFQENAIPLQKASYSFTLVARDAVGNESRQDITINISDYEEQRDTVIPEVPTSLVASDVNYPNKIVINWSAVNGADYYKLYISNNETVTINSANVNVGKNTSYEYEYDGEGYNAEGYSITYFGVVACNSNNECSSISQIVRGSIKKEFSEYIDISGYWSNELGTELIHYSESDEKIKTTLVRDVNNNCYNSFSIFYKRINFNTVEEENDTYTVDRENDYLVITNQIGESINYHQVSSQPFYDSRSNCD